MDDLLIKYLLQECSPKEEAAVQEWLRQDVANQKRYDGFVWLWQQSKNIGGSSTVNVDAAWQQFVSLRTQKAPAKTPVVALGANRRRWLMVAASAMVLLAAAWAYYLVKPRSGENPAIAMVKWETIADTFTDTLPDGSIVTLNKNSSLVFPSAFADSTRNLKLEGEAFFEVTPSKQQPFIVSVNDVTVRVVGTSFNVRSRKGITRVVVESGAVQVSHHKKMVTLAKNEQVTVKDSGALLQKETTTNPLYRYYLDRLFVCNDMPLPTLVEALNEAYDANIVIDQARLNNLRITTTFNKEPLGNILFIITETMGIQAVPKGDTIFLR